MGPEESSPATSFGQSGWAAPSRRVWGDSGSRNRTHRDGGVSDRKHKGCGPTLVLLRQTFESKTVQRRCSSDLRVAFQEKCHLCNRFRVFQKGPGQDLIWKQGLCRCDQAKTRSQCAGVAPPLTGVLGRGTRTQTQGDGVKRRAGRRV